MPEQQVPEYQVLARRYRPQTFAEVYGQEAIVTTLKNAILHKRLAHAYLFCGSRGTGKTTLARVFAKALNCQTVRDDLEPCNHCSSCLEIASGSSLEVLEIDGASNRGIDDIRQINETVSYASAAGGYKIYLIDEVHMLTKEAFNALLKTLEEPPPRVVFFFATTEPHKLPTTILSRCQRFNLNRLPIELILKKLAFIAEQQQVDITEQALRVIAGRAEGGMRDAESLMDQILAFHDGKVTAESVAEVLGIVSKEIFFELDQAVKAGNLAAGFDLVHRIFSQGKDLIHFIESLMDHFRTILIVKIADKNAPFLTLSADEGVKYAETAKIYTQEQCLTILDSLVEALSQFRFMPSGRIALEALLLKIIRIHQRIPADYLVRQLNELEEAIRKGKVIEETASVAPATVAAAIAPPTPASKEVLKEVLVEASIQEESAEVVKVQVEMHKQTEALKVKLDKGNLTEITGIAVETSISIDPSPTPQELGLIVKTPIKTAPLQPQPQAAVIPHAITPSAPIELGARPSPESQLAATKKQSRYDTILQFAAVELEGSLQKTGIKGF